MTIINTPCLCHVIIIYTPCLGLRTKSFVCGCRTCAEEGTALLEKAAAQGGAVQVDSIKTRVESAPSFSA